MKKEFSENVKKAALLFAVDIIVLGGLCALVSAMTLSKVLPQELLETVGTVIPTVSAFLSAIIVCSTLHKCKLQIAAMGQGTFLLLEILLRIVTNTAAAQNLLIDVLGIAVATLFAVVISNLSGTKKGRNRYRKPYSR